MDRACAGQFGLCKLLATLFPHREEYKFKSGKISAVELWRGIKPCTNVWVRCDNAYVVTGNYYNTSGELVSIVDNGSGTATFFYENGKIEKICIFKNGRERKIIEYYKDGKIKKITPIDPERYFEGNVVEYYPNGNKMEESVFVNRNKIGIHREWYSSGKLKELVKYDKFGKIILSKKFDTSGKVIK